MKTKLFFAVTEALFITSCRKEKTTNQNIGEPYIQFSDTALAYVQLPLHKYFIYKDSATGTLDSVVVTKSDIEKSYGPSQNFGWGNSASSYYQYFTLGLKNLVELLVNIGFMGPHLVILVMVYMFKVQSRQGFFYMKKIQ